MNIYNIAVTISLSEIKVIEIKSRTPEEAIEAAENIYGKPCRLL